MQPDCLYAAYVVMILVRQITSRICTTTATNFANVIVRVSLFGPCFVDLCIISNLQRLLHVTTSLSLTATDTIVLLVQDMRVYKGLK